MSDKLQLIKQRLLLESRLRKTRDELARIRRQKAYVERVANHLEER